ncbi:MAG: ATP-dependent sacrificial sulfur transferase LarE [Actinomycetota bacterium]
MPEAKLAALRLSLAKLPGAIVAYSGGADSAFLAEVAHEVLQERCLAVTADSASLPRSELHEAIQLAVDRGWRHEMVATDELNDERYAANPTNRCYFCKSALFDRLEDMSLRLGWPVLLGTNSDDLSDWRPGQKASQERGGLHPMVDAGLTKDEIRSLSKEMGLVTADKPASACLASRFAYGVRVTSAGLERIERAEAWMHSQNYPIVRIRDLGKDRARVEVDPKDVARASNQSNEIERQLLALGFCEVMVDPVGYRQGALNEVLIPLGVSR